MPSAERLPFWSEEDEIKSKKGRQPPIEINPRKDLYTDIQKSIKGGGYVPEELRPPEDVEGEKDEKVGRLNQGRTEKSYQPVDEISIEDLNPFYYAETEKEAERRSRKGGDVEDKNKTQQTTDMINRMVENKETVPREKRRLEEVRGNWSSRPRKGKKIIPLRPETLPKPIFVGGSGRVKEAVADREQEKDRSPKSRLPYYLKPVKEGVVRKIWKEEEILKKPLVNEATKTEVVKPVVKPKDKLENRLPPVDIGVWKKKWDARHGKGVGA